MSALLSIMMVAAGLGADAPPAWDAETLQLFATMPIQDDGRVKPMDTFAQFTLLRLNGKRTLSLPDGPRLTSTAWLLDVLFFPDKAKEFPCFIVDNAEAIVALGLIPHDKKRDRYSYNELDPGRTQLMNLARHYSESEAKDRTLVEQQIVNLASNIMHFESIVHAMDFARKRFAVEGDTELAKAFPEKDGVPMSVVLERGPAVLRSVSDKAKTLDDDALKAEREAMSKLLNEVEEAVSGAQTLALFPPANPAEKQWQTPADTCAAAFDVAHGGKAPAGDVAALERLAEKCGNPTAFKAELAALHADIKARASARGEYAKIPLEVSYYKGKYLFYSQWLFVLSCLLVAISWMMPTWKWIHRVTPVSVLIPLVLLVIGITLRCIIRGRPPVTTLYETILFCTAVAALVSLCIEWMNRQRIAVAMGAFLGAIGMFIANRYEIKEGVDTMPSLIAVLDTNFWLATHVTTVTVGYAAGMLAGALAHIYILGKLVGFRTKHPGFYTGVGKMVYGTLCFGFLFAIVGTVLGGIWANESWGRFWGWDPKENGALMIVLWCLVVLHLRQGGYISAMGTCVGAVLLGMVTAFSWWGVNQLGVGLHSYGFTSGILRMLIIFWVVESLVALAGIALSRKEPSSLSGS
ncbi:MAG TPA: cytochrome c biogenesis protein CcsA [Candidatus Hydrogenedentes bacterium]|nr:cytochrome c biogenesis protein CcsA [Candidatus Hydrogenedentota bacterium]